MSAATVAGHLDHNLSHFCTNSQQQASSSVAATGAIAQNTKQILMALNNGSGLSPSLDDSKHPLTSLVVNYLLEPTDKLDRWLNFYLDEIWSSKYGDERTNTLPFVSGGPWKLICATLFYVYLVKRLLPNWMDRRAKAFELNWLIRMYNLLMVASNLYAFYHGVRILRFGLACFGCEIIQHQDYSAQAIELLHYGWLFFLSRIVEWLDTIFFVLRKKNNQVTKLHLFHHSFVPFLVWIYLKYHPGYTAAFFPLINTLVHSIMYTYYLLATFGPRMQPYLWWKKYLTSLQITQFVLILIQLASIPLSSNDKCQYPASFLYAGFAGAILFLWLFYSFYVETYVTTDRKGGAKRPSQFPKSILKVREGASKSLSDAVDNAIATEVEHRKFV